MLDVYLASPKNQLQAHLASGMDVLVSYYLHSEWQTQYMTTYRRLLIDSGAFSALNGATVDVFEYRDWLDEMRPQLPNIVACAGLDSIEGDWRTSLKNLEVIPQTFGVYHDTDPPELLNELVAIAKERDGWLGIGLHPPRTRRVPWMRRTLDRIDLDEIHVHGFALVKHSYLPWGSVDSTEWWRGAMMTQMNVAHLTAAERLEIQVKRYQRRTPRKDSHNDTIDLFDD